MAQNIVWPGSGSSPVGVTAFGFYDSDVDFITQAPQFATWAARRLGYPIVDIELQDYNFYACFEEAVTEYSAQVNQFNIRNNLTILQGASTGSTVTQRNVQGSPVPFIVRLSEGYGAEVGAGGDVEWRRGYITVGSGSQEYDLNALWADTEHSGSAITIKRVHHYGKPAISRFFDPYSLSGQGYTNLIDEFGFGSYSPAAQFLLMPVWEDVLRTQAIEFNDHVRKSAFSFELINNKLRIFPIPTDEYKIYFDYVLDSDVDNQFLSGSGSSGSLSDGTISDYSDVPYTNMTYGSINDVGRQWIRRYALALSKEALGMVRSKYQTVPIPGDEVTLDGNELRSEAQTEKEQLIVELRENLEELSRKNQMEVRSQETELHQEMLRKIPLPIYIG